MIDPDKINPEEKGWAALEHLRKTEDEHAQLVEQKSLKEHMLKHVEALCIVAQDNQEGAALIKQAKARASDRYKEAIEEKAAADAEFALSYERRDRAWKTISLAQT